MPDHIIIAHDAGPAPTRFFWCYKDDGEYCEIVWAFNPWDALRFEAGEAEIEAKLVAALCPSFFVQSWSLAIVERRDRKSG